jgi:hypothetical protein
MVFMSYLRRPVSLDHPSHLELKLGLKDDPPEYMRCGDP